MDLKGGKFMDPRTFPTKGNLMLAKNSLSLARQGYDLMDKKRNILIRELMDLIEEARTIQEDIDSTFMYAYQCLQRANIENGISTVELLAYTVPIENSITIQLAPLGISVFSCTPMEPEKKEKPAKAKKTTHSTKSVKEKAETDLQSMMAEAAAVFNGKAGETAAAAAERLAGISDKLAEAKAGLSSKIISLSSIARRQAGLEEGLDKKVGKE